MTQPSLISIIIPCYNQGHLLAQAIDSALAQAYPHVEVIVVDDGSTDNTCEIAQRYVGRVRYVRQQNAGLSAARNTGLTVAKGNYVNFLDSDDRLLPEKLARQAPLLEADPGLALVYCRHFVTDADGNRTPAEKRESPRGEVYHALRRGNFLPVHSALVRRACIQEAGGFDAKLRALEDWDLWLRIALRYRFDRVEEPLVEYRDLGDSMSKDYYRMTEAFFQVMQRHTLDHDRCPECRRADDYLYTWLRLGRAPQIYRGAAQRFRQRRWQEGRAWLRMGARIYPTYLFDPKRWLRGSRKAARFGAQSVLLGDSPSPP